MVQMATSAACLRFHEIGPRLARWLLIIGSLPSTQASSPDCGKKLNPLAMGDAKRRTDTSNAMTDPRPNRLLAMLPESAKQRLEHASAVISVTAGSILLDAGELISYVFFPLDAVVSLDQVISQDEDEHARGPCVALVGSEGMVGIESLLGFDEAINRATVRISGRLARLEVAPLVEEFRRTGALHRLVVGSAGALTGQTCAISACERVHSVRQRVIRWLLMFADRAQSSQLPLTQELLSELIGVRRASISAAAAELQAEDLIAYQRGSLMLCDRDRLEAGACKCYREIKALYTDYLDAA